MSATQMVEITGNTYPVKEALKAIGCRWKGDAKAWMCSVDKVTQAQAIVAGAGVKSAYTPTAAKSSYRPMKCSQCGQGRSKYVKIYRNGVCGPCIGDARAEGGYN